MKRTGLLQLLSVEVYRCDAVVVVDDDVPPLLPPALVPVPVPAVDYDSNPTSP